jgi:hypothetical protein
MDKIHFRNAPLNNQIAPLWGVGPTLGNTDLKGSDDGVSHSELLGFLTLSIVRYSKN